MKSKDTTAGRVQFLLDLMNTWVMGPNGRKVKILKKKDVLKILKDLDNWS